MVGWHTSISQEIADSKNLKRVGVETGIVLRSLWCRQISRYPLVCPRSGDNPCPHDNYMKIVNKRHKRSFVAEISRIVYSQPHITNALKEVFAFVSRVSQWLLGGYSPLSDPLVIL